MTGTPLPVVVLTHWRARHSQCLRTYTNGPRRLSPAAGTCQLWKIQVPQRAGHWCGHSVAPHASAQPQWQTATKATHTGAEARGTSCFCSALLCRKQNCAAQTQQTTTLCMQCCQHQCLGVVQIRHCVSLFCFLSWCKFGAADWQTTPLPPPPSPLISKIVPVWHTTGCGVQWRLLPFNPPGALYFGRKPRQGVIRDLPLVAFGTLQKGNFCTLCLNVSLCWSSLWGRGMPSQLLIMFHF